MLKPCQGRALSLCVLWLLSALSHGAITLDHYDASVLSDVKTLYTSATWGQAVTDAWNAVGTMEGVAVYMLQTTSAPTPEIIAKIEGAEEIKLDHFASPDMFFFFATKLQATDLRKMAEVADVQAVPPLLKVLPSLRKLQTAQGANANMQPDVLIELSPGSKGSYAQASALAGVWEGAVHGNVGGSAAKFVAESEGMIALRQVKGTEMARSLEIVASQPEALVLEEQIVIMKDPELTPVVIKDIDATRRRLNDEADDITQSGSVGITPLQAAGLDGTGQIVGIADSGLDMKSCFFHGPNGNLPLGQEADLSQRKVIQYIPFADGLANEPNDHGTHVAGSVAGQCINPAGTKFNGMAPNAKIHFFDIGISGQPSLSVPRNLATGLFPMAKTAGAAIHTNSWGSNSNRYTSSSRDVDAYSYQNEEFVILVAAGNSGAQGPNSVGSPATAKNCISVGASLNAKRGNIEDIASFSSIGPTADGRIKPDVVAPGHNVESAASVRPCSVTSQSGTSMATPICAGNVALLRQYFREGRYPSGDKVAADAFTPSGALLKAMIIHSGKAMAGNIKGDTYPGNVQGFGRIDMDSVLKLGSTTPERGEIWIRSSKVGVDKVELQAGQTFEKDFSLTATGKLKATLVWMDPPSTLNAQRNLVNDLDLEIVTPAGTKVFPNGGNARDTLNNVEMIEHTATAPGTFKVRVTATAIRQGTAQLYALVVTGPFSTASSAGDKVQPSPDLTPPVATPGQYQRITNSTCASKSLSVIKDLVTCQVAALGLGLADKTADSTFPQAITMANVPEGCYLKGTRLYVGQNPANIGNGADAERTPICKSTATAYEKLANGTCEEKGMFVISDPATCEAAALELGLDDQTVTNTPSVNRPEGCYYKGLLPGSALWLSTNAANRARGSSAGRHQICAASQPRARSVTGLTTSKAAHMQQLSVIFAAVLVAMLGVMTF